MPNTFFAFDHRQMQGSFSRVREARCFRLSAFLEMLVTIAPPDARRANALSRALRQACSVDVMLSDVEGSEIGALRAAMRRVRLGVLIVERRLGERVVIAHPDLAGPEARDEDEQRVVVVERRRCCGGGDAGGPPSGAHALDSFVLLAALVHEAHGGRREVFEPHIVPAPARIIGHIMPGAYPPPSGSLAQARRHRDAWKARFLGAEHEHSLTACDGRLVAEDWSPFWNTLLKQLDAHFGGVYDCFSPHGFQWEGAAEELHEDLRGFKDDPIVMRLSGWATFHRTTVWVLYHASGCWLELAPKFKGFAHGRAMPGRAVALELNANGLDARFWIAPSVEQHGNTPVRRMWSDDTAVLVARARGGLAARRAAELIQRHARAASARNRERDVRLALRTQLASIEIQRHVRGWRTRVWREVVIIDGIPYAMPML